MSEQMTQYQRNLIRMWDSLRANDYVGDSDCVAVPCEKCPLNHVVCSKTVFNAEKAIEIVSN